MDIIMAVAQGADDRITRPFALELLVAKIQALLRRTYDYQNEERETIEHQGIILDIGSGVLAFGSKKIELTKNEQNVMVLLRRNKTKIVSRERLMKSLWDNEYFVNENTLTVNINTGIYSKKLELKILS